ncbi:MAG: site-2 protease family protein [Candidatus Micrarchaeaceae archaeon]
MAGFSPTIGKIAGIEIELHWSFLLLLLFVLLVSLYVFALFVILFICVLLHELSHSLTSQHYKIKVKKIVLLPIGGISVMDLDTVKPKQEFYIALAGPLASLAIGFAFWAIVPFAPAGIIRQTITFTFEINLLLGIFNLLPGFPLDGGRVFRAYLERSRSYIRSTQITVKASNIVLLLFVLGTIIFAVFAKGYSLVYREFLVFYDIFIVMFLYSGSQAELQSAYMKEYASDLHVSDALSKNFIIVNKNENLYRVYGKMLKKHTNIVLFKEGRNIKLARIPTRSQLPNYEIMERPISEFGIKLPEIDYNEGLYKALSEMQSANSALLVVTNGRKIAGILSEQHTESILALHVSNKLHKKREGVAAAVQSEGNK